MKTLNEILKEKGFDHVEGVDIRLEVLDAVQDWLLEQKKSRLHPVAESMLNALIREVELPSFCNKQSSEEQKI
jgi:hypothetical protein